MSRVQVNIPLLDICSQFGADIELKFPHTTINWPDALWLRELNGSSHLKNGGYHCTPLNSLAFAWTGTEGQHFSFLVQDSTVDSNSPVILTAPDNYGAEETVIIAENFRTFMRLALRYGCFELTELAYAPETAIQAFTVTPDVSKTDQRNDLRQQIRAFVASQLNLPPYYYTAARFNGLQQQYKPLLKMPSEY